LSKTEEQKISWLKKELQREGLTDEQVEAGIKYYKNFCKKFDINIAKSKRMFINNIENMKEAFRE